MPMRLKDRVMGEPANVDRTMQTDLSVTRESIAAHHWTKDPARLFNHDALPATFAAQIAVSAESS
jgi:hypothetical protein